MRRPSNATQNQYTQMPPKLAIHSKQHALIVVSSKTMPALALSPADFIFPKQTPIFMYLLVVLAMQGILLLLLAYHKKFWFKKTKKGHTELPIDLPQIAHDLKSPFKACYDLVDLLSYYVEKQDWKNLKLIAGELESYSRNVDLLLDTLLYWSLPYPGTDDSCPKKKSFAGLIREIAPVYDRLAYFKGSTIHWSINDCGETNIDERAVMLIVRNLLDNAIKYTPTGSVIKIQILQTKKSLTIATRNPIHRGSSERTAQLLSAIKRKQNDIRAGAGLTFILQAVRMLKASIKAQAQTPPDHLTITISIPTI